MSRPSGVAWRAAGLMVAMALTAGASWAGPVFVQQGVIDPLWFGDSDPSVTPTDYEGTAPNYGDNSGILDWGLGFHEPGDHSYNPNTKTIRMSNAWGPDRVKVLWLRLQWRPDQASGLPDFQAPGELLDPSKWASAESSHGVGVPTAAAWDVSPVGSVVVTMKFLFDPQPDWENIFLGPLLGDPAVQPNSIRVQTICIPAPSAALALTGLLMCARRRRG